MGNQDLEATHYLFLRHGFSVLLDCRCASDCRSYAPRRTLPDPRSTRRLTLSAVIVISRCWKERRASGRFFSRYVQWKRGFSQGTRMNATCARAAARGHLNVLCSNQIR